MSHYVSIDNKDFDLNSLFNFSHSYEILKNVIYTIGKSNKQLSYQISDVSEDLKIKETMIKDVFAKLRTMKEMNKHVVELADNNFNNINENLITLNNNLRDFMEQVSKKFDDVSIKEKNPPQEDKRIRNSIINIKETLDDHKDTYKEKSLEKLRHWDNSIKDEKLKQESSKKQQRLDEEQNENKRLQTKSLSKKMDNSSRSKDNKRNDYKENEYREDKVSEKNNKKNDFLKTEEFSDRENKTSNNYRERDREDNNNYNNNNNYNTTAYKNYDNNNNNNYERPSQNNSERGESDDNVVNNVQGNNNNNNRTSTFNINTFVNKLESRVLQLEREMDEINFEKGTAGRKSTSRDSSLKFFDLKKISENAANSIEELKEKILNLEVRGNNFDDKLEELTIKCQDLDIYEQLKSGGENTNLDQSLILVQSLEKKLFKKFEFTDEKQRKIEDDQNRIRNEISKQGKKIDDISKDVQENGYLVDSAMRNMSATPSKRVSMQPDDVGVRKAMEMITDLEKKINEKMKELRERDYTDNDYEKLKPWFWKALQEKIHVYVSPDLENEVNRINKELIKKTTDLDKQIKIMVSNVNVDKINSEIAKLNEGLQRKINLEDFSELKSNTNLISHQVTYLKETLSQVVDDRKVLEDITWLRKKVENLTNSMLSFKSNDEITTSGSKGGMGNIDASKFLDANVFNAFHKNYVKDMEFIKQLTDDNRNNLDSIEEKLRLRVSDTDMKNLEEYLLNRIEEVRILLSKKFADKVDTNRSIKYVEAQIKHVVDVYIKKMEKGDNWMLAKKPVGGYTCASCENYLGDLNDKQNDYTVWNKYPAREISDKAYKMGNGFSRMLQMLNVDLRKSDYNMSDNDDDFRRSQIPKKKNLLPEISHREKMRLSKEKDKNLHNTSMDNALNGHSINDDHMRSKIVKIVKKKV